MAAIAHIRTLTAITRRGRSSSKRLRDLGSCRRIHDFAAVQSRAGPPSRVQRRAKNWVAGTIATAATSQLHAAWSVPRG